ncbi:MAG: hypothetical protein WCG80_06400 [Spirochaetales bacterium]
MAKSKNDILKAGRKVVEKASAAGLAVTALAKVVERLEKLQKERQSLKAQLEKNGDDAKLVWKALKAEVKGLEAELKQKPATTKTVTAKPAIRPAAKAPVKTPTKAAPKKPAKV